MLFPLFLHSKQAAAVFVKKPQPHAIECVSSLSPKLKITRTQPMHFCLPKGSILYCLVFILGGKLTAQETASHHSLSLSAGPAHIARQDLVFSPMIHRDFTPVQLGIGYQCQARLTHTFRVDYASFNPTLREPYDFTEYGEDQNAWPHYFTLIGLNYTAAKAIRESGKWTTKLGGAAHWDIQALNYSYGRISSFGYVSLTGMGVYAQQSYQASERWLVHGQVQLPLLLWQARSPYLVNDDEFIENIASHSGFKSFMAFLADGHLTSLHEVQSVDLELSVFYLLTKKWQLGASYHLDLLRMAEPRPLLSVRNAVQVSAHFQF